MKNFLILGLLAGLLFSVSAAMSLWLNQKPADPNAEKEKDKDKDKDKDKSKGPKSDGPKETTDAKPSTKLDSPPPPPSSPETGAALFRERESKLKLRADQLELVVRDLQAQRESTDAALKAVTSELKNVTVETNRLDALAEDLKKKKVEFEAGEKKNIEKIATMYDSMSPEAAAPTFKQMGDNGKLDMAAKILTQMKERNAARVLEAMNDPALALQILDKMRNIRAGTPAAPGTPTTPGAPAAPAKGP